MLLVALLIVLVQVVVLEDPVVVVFLEILEVVILGVHAAILAGLLVVLEVVLLSLLHLHVLVVLGVQWVPDLRGLLSQKVVGLELELTPCHLMDDALDASRGQWTLD